MRCYRNRAKKVKNKANMLDPVLLVENTCFYCQGNKLNKLFYTNINCKKRY